MYDRFTNTVWFCIGHEHSVQVTLGLAHTCNLLVSHGRPNSCLHFYKQLAKWREEWAELRRLVACAIMKKLHLDKSGLTYLEYLTSNLCTHTVFVYTVGVQLTIHEFFCKARTMTTSMPTMWW